MISLSMIPAFSSLKVFRICLPSVVLPYAELFLRVIEKDEWLIPGWSSFWNGVPGEIKVNTLG